MGKPVQLKLYNKGDNPATQDMTVHGVYAATRYDIGDKDDRGRVTVQGEAPYYVLRDDTADRVGLVAGLWGLDVREV